MSEEHGGPPAEQGIGRRLEEAREKKGLSFQEVEGSTKIRARYLRELERENFAVLPAVYVLGSLKTYADFLGLDGAALSRELKGTLEPEEPEVAGPREPEEDYEAAPAAVIGFNQLFLGMGVLIVSVLAIMTLVSAVAPNVGPPKVSQVDEPSVQEAPEEMDLARNVRSGSDPQLRNAARSDEKETAQRVEENRDEPEPPKGGGDRKNGKEGKENKASFSQSLFGDAEFVPMSPAGPPGASASATATAAATATASATAAPAGPAPDPAPKTAAASSSASPGPSEAYAASPAPSGPVPNAASENYGDRRPVSGAVRDRGPARGMDADGLAAEIVADVRAGLREGGIGR